VSHSEVCSTVGFEKARLLVDWPREVIEDAESEGLLRPYTGSRIFEGTVGSTGISIATIARARCVRLLDDSSSTMYTQPLIGC
jgi:cysteine synthase